MASAALKTLLACSSPQATTRRDLGELAADFDATVLDFQTEGPSILLFDRPRQAVEWALAWNQSAPGQGAENQGLPPQSTKRGRSAVHLGEVIQDGHHLELDPAAREHLERLMRLALDGQTLVSTAVEGLLRHNSLSGSESSELPHEWAWRHHGRYRFSDEETAIDVIEVGADPALLQAPRLGHRLEPGQEDGVELRPGERLLRYRILDILGRGGMGVVYRAEDGRLQRQVALKMLPPRLSGDRQYLQRFEREVQAIAAVSHPNIVTIHNVEHDGDLRFLTMELVEGEQLADAIPEAGMPLEQVLEIASALADALVAAHRSGIVHRDLKPSNIMLSRDGLVKILDFGLAKLRDEERDSVTDPGQMIGTLAYMAPEQIRGHDVDARSDIFSLGVLIYEMLTGQRPFKGQGASLMYAVLHDEPGTLDGAPQALAELIAHALQKDPEKRLGSAEEFRHRLLSLRRDAGFSSSGTFSSRHFPPPRTPRRFAAGPLLMAAGVILAVMTAAAVGAGLFSWRSTFEKEPGSIPGEARAGGDEASEHIATAAHSETLPRLVVLPCRNENTGARDPFFAPGLTTDITSRLAGAANLEVISYASALAYINTKRPLSEIAEELQVSHIVTCGIHWLDAGETPEPHSPSGTDHVVSLTIEVLRSADQQSIEKHTFTEGHDDDLELQALLAQDVVVELARTFSASASPQRPSSNIKAHYAYLRGLHQASLPDYTPSHRRAIIRHFEEAVDADPSFILAWAELAKARALYFHLRHDESPAQSQRALEAVVNARRLDPDSAEVRLAEGLLHYWTERDYEAALVDLAYAAERLPNHWEVYASIAWIHRRRGNGELAWSNLSRALMLNPRDPVLRTHSGITATWLRHYDEARDLLESAIAQAPDKPMAFWFLALTHWVSSGDLDLARQVLEAMPENDPRIHWYWFRQLLYERRPAEARRRLDAIEGEWIDLTDFTFPKSLAVALAYQIQGEDEEARPAWIEALKTLRREATQRQPPDPRLLAALGVAEAAVGDRKAALEAGSRAIAIRPLESDAYEGPSYLEHQAWIHLLLGEKKEAIRLLAGLLEGPSRLSPELLALDPRWDDLKDEPGFQELLNGPLGSV